MTRTVQDLLIDAINLQSANKSEDAVALFNNVLALDPANAAALYSLSIVAINAGDTVLALDYTERGVASAPAFAPLHFAHGSVLQQIGKLEGAMLSYDKALAIQPDYSEVLLNSGVLLRTLHRHKDALERFIRVLETDPNNQGALVNSGILLTEFKENKQAIAMFERLLKINPDFDYVLGLLLYERMHCCDWTDFDWLTEQIVNGVNAGKRVCKSLAFMSINDEAELHFKATKIFADGYCPKQAKSLWNGEQYNHKKIRIAYVSPDLREHPVGHLMAGIFENHDKSIFETFAISLGIDDQSRLRGRMMKAFDQFIDVREQSAEKIAMLIRELEIDIAIDLGGYTSDTRTEIFSYRPAPVQINYLGYPGTMAVDYYDFLIADQNVIPEESKRFFSEKIVYLPKTYLPTDASIKITERTPSRFECGLPETGFVFCSFSHDYKISPKIFDIWMRLLLAVPGSVLWLMSRNEQSIHNLRQAAERQGVAADRLVFANRVPLIEDHLARYRLADLFLDTYPYNAHTTAADALMAGVPVVTHQGNSFPSRVAASLLHAIDMSELITTCWSDYEALACRIATSPAFCNDLKARLATRDNALFNTQCFTRDLEAVLLSCMPSESIDVITTDFHNDTATNRIEILLPIYKPILSPIEQFALDQSLRVLANYPITFVAAQGLDVSYYRQRYGGGVRFFGAEYFSSVSNYSRLLVSRHFYDAFQNIEYLLILQSDVYVFHDDLPFWLAQNVDYVGAPWPNGYELRVEVGKFAEAGGIITKAFVGNGGFSLRRRQGCLDLIDEFPDIADWFVKTGSNEDLFFSLIGGLSNNFRIPNQMVASRFALELAGEFYVKLNDGRLPMAVHAFEKHNPQFWRQFMPCWSPVD